MVKIKHFFYATFVVASILIITSGFKINASEISDAPSMDSTKYKVTSAHYPACLKMYYCIEKYSKVYNIPKQYAYGIAYMETKFTNPFQWGYDHRQISSAGALGPMQIMLPTAKSVWNDNDITKEKLLYDIEFNVETSMKYLSILYSQYKDWKKVFGCYNTGQPIVNSYANNVYKHKN